MKDLDAFFKTKEFDLLSIGNLQNVQVVYIAINMGRIMGHKIGFRVPLNLFHKRESKELAFEIRLILWFDSAYFILSNRLSKVQ